MLTLMLQIGDLPRSRLDACKPADMLSARGVDQWCWAGGVGFGQCQEVLGAGSGGWSFQVLLELLLPLAAGAVTQALERLSSLPSFAAAALCLFSLVEPSVISAGRPPPSRLPDPGFGHSHLSAGRTHMPWGSTDKENESM